MSDSEYGSRKLTVKESNLFDSDDETAFASNKKKVPLKQTSRRGIESDDDDLIRNKRNTSKATTSKATTSKATTSKATTSKRRPNESDDETVSRRKKETKAPAKRKRPSSASSAKKSQDICKIFDSESEDEANSKPQELRSAYVKRVADGVLRRTEQLEGDIFLDLKLYQVADIKDIHPRKRHEKAVLALRYQSDHDSPELKLLQQLLKRCKSKFGSEGYFFGDNSKD